MMQVNASRSRQPGWGTALSYLGWLYLVGVTVAVAVVAPVLIDLQPRSDIAFALIAMGAALVGIGIVRRMTILQGLGALVLWSEIVWGITSQITPFGTSLGAVLGPRGIILTAAFIVWVLLLRPTAWVLSGMIAAGISTLVLLAVLWATAPPVGRTVSLQWLATDSKGTLYATETDLGVIWVFDANGSRSNLWPRRAAPGTPGPGLQPAGFGSELAQAGGTSAVTPNGLPDRTLVFCGLAIDPQDNLYVIDPDLRIVQAFARDGSLRTAWSLPPSFVPAQGCLAANTDHVFVADHSGAIYVFDHQGDLQTQWQQPAPAGLAINPQGDLLVLLAKSVRALQYPTGNTVREWPLPEPIAGRATPYQALAITSIGELLVTDLNQGLVRRFAPNGKELEPIGRTGDWPGQFFGAGGLPGELAEPQALAEDRQHEIYVSDSAYRVIQRFQPNGRVDAVITVPEAEANEMRRANCPNVLC